MHLFDIVPAAVRIEKGYQWRVVFTGTNEDQQKSPFFKFLMGIKNGNKPHEFDALMKLFADCSEKGPEALPSNNRHHLDADNSIYEFIKGRYRIAWFYEDGKVIICTHGFFKSTQKAPKEEQIKAVKHKKKFQAAKKTGMLRGL